MKVRAWLVTMRNIQFFTEACLLKPLKPQGLQSMYPGSHSAEIFDYPLALT